MVLMRKHRRGIPLKTFLTAVLVLVILTSTGLVGYIAQRHSHKTVYEMGRLLLQEISARIVEHIRAYLDTPHRINELNATAMEEGRFSPDDPGPLERRFWRQIGIYTTVSSIYFGNSSGGIVNSGREAEGDSFYVIFTEGNKAGPFFKYRVDEEGRKTTMTNTIPSFDARARSWYSRAAEKGGSVWSDIYILFTGQDMALAASRPVYGEDGGLLGVVSVDIFLSRIEQFLRSLSIAETGIAFVMERSGLLVAASTGTPALRPPEGEAAARRLGIQESEHPLIGLAGEQFAVLHGNGETFQKPLHTTFSKNGENYLFQISPLRDPYGIDWLAAVIVPQSDFTGMLEDGNRITNFFILLVLSASVLLATFAARWLTKPILRLNEATGALAKGKLPVGIEVDSMIMEVRELANAFNHMAARLHGTIEGLHTEVEQRRRIENALRESEEKLRVQAARDHLTGLPNRRAFIDRLENELARVRRFRTKCALMMIDIDHFKLVNDRNGHAAGDRVLKAFANVLGATLRQADFAGRLGGEEFGLLLPETTPSAALVLAERLRRKFEELHVETPSGTIRFTASVGVAAVLPEDESIDAPLARADEALYRAKSKGRNRVED